nr:MAG TPA: hypothetical protein [Caudoviricetes sp.]
MSKWIATPERHRVYVVRSLASCFASATTCAAVCSDD